MRWQASQNFGPFDPRWRPVQVAAMVTRAEAAVMLNELIAAFGRQGAAMVCGVPGLTLNTWRASGVGAAAARRVVWFAWALLLHPEKLQTAWDLVTWGRFADNPKVKRRVAKLCREMTPQEPGVKAG